MLSVTAGLTCALTLLAAAQSFALSRRCTALSARWRRVVLLDVDRGRALERLQTLADVQKVAEAAVHGTAATVQTVHRGIAAIPFGILEAVPIAREPTRIVRAIHDLTANSVYGAITGINRWVGRGLRGTGHKKPKA